MSKCKHETALVWTRNREEQTWTTVGTMSGGDRDRRYFDRVTCVSCGAWLSLGTANDDDERVRVELRAAAIIACREDGNAASLRGELDACVCYLPENMIDSPDEEEARELARLEMQS